MIRRRIAEHLKAQNWFAVAIDFVIVVIGVFVGIQVSNWNAARADRQRGDAFAVRLADDLRFEARSYATLISYYGSALSEARKAVAALEGGAPLTDEQLLVSAYRATQYLRFASRNAVYQELIATGAIGLVRNDRLRETAIFVYSATILQDVRKDSAGSAFRTLFRQTVQASAQAELLAKCGDRVLDTADGSAKAASLDYPCSLDLPAEVLRASAAALRGDGETLPSLRKQVADLETALNNLKLGGATLREGLADYEAAE